jgi:hypothetical protein
MNSITPKSLWIYTRERFPIPVYLLLTAGYALSSQAVLLRRIDGLSASLTLAYLLFFFYELRFMDETKDYEKDRVINPTRPIARGLFPVQSARRLVWVLWLALLGVGATFFGAGFDATAILCTIIAGWLALMYLEFFVGEKLGKHPFTYAVTHQVILIPIAMLGGSWALGREIFQSPEAWALAGMQTCSFFTYEVCRKLDPKTHLLQRTYLQAHGPWITAFACVILIAGSHLCAHLLGLHAYLLPIQLLILVCLILSAARPERYKLTEGAATLGLLAHLWVPLVTLTQFFTQNSAGLPGGQS